MNFRMRSIKIIIAGIFGASILLMLLPFHAYSSREFYTVQTASFVTLDDARKHYDSIIRKIKGEKLDHLRIEKIGNYFSIRIGKRR